jgi:hypothetical protein
MPDRIPLIRQATRHPVWLTANCRTSAGAREDAILSDISTDGCGLTGVTVRLHVGQKLYIRPGSLEAQSGTVCWTRGSRAGVRFDRPLYGPVVEHLVRIQVR